MKITKETLFFIALLCSFFSVAICPINPSYLLMLFILISAFYFFLLNLKLNKITVISLIFFILFSINNLVALYNQGSEELFRLRINYNISIDSSILFLLCFFVGIVTFNITYYSHESKRQYIYKSIIPYLIFFLSIELVSRILLEQPDEDFIYRFKHGPFFFDSNFLGITIALILCFYQFLYKYKLAKLNKKETIALHFFLICSFSRAAILGYLISRVILYKFKYIKYSVIFLLLIQVIVINVMFLMYKEGNNFQNIDGSFNSKFYIIDKALSLYQDMPLYIKMIGIGLNNLQYYIGIFAHNIFVTFLLEFGLLGSAIFILYIYFLICKSNWEVIYVVLPIIIIGFSLFGAYSPHFFIFSNIIMAEVWSRRKNTVHT